MAPTTVPRSLSRARQRCGGDLMVYPAGSSRVTLQPREALLTAGRGGGDGHVCCARHPSVLYARHLARRACAARACAARARASRDLWHCWLASAPALLQCQDFGHRRQLRAYLWGGGVDDCLGEHTSRLTQQKVLLLYSQGAPRRPFLLRHQKCSWRRVVTRVRATYAWPGAKNSRLRSTCTLPVMVDP